MGKRRIYLALLAVLVVAIVVGVVLTRPPAGAPSAPTTPPAKPYKGSATARDDGGELKIDCGGLALHIDKASYTEADGMCTDYDATADVAALVGPAGEKLEVTLYPDTLPEASECKATRDLDVGYTCGTLEKIVPRRELCRGDACDPDPELRVWAGEGNRNWTAAPDPWNDVTRVDLTAGAPSPASRGRYWPIDPNTRIGVTDRVNVWSNPQGGVYASPCSSARPVYSTQPFERGFLEEKENDSTDGTMAQRRTFYMQPYWSAPARRPPPPKCPEDLGIEMNLEGDYATWLASEESRGLGLGDNHPHFYPPSAAPAYGAPPKEGLRSRRNYRATAERNQCLSGVGCGLGSTWIDPRFQPNAQEMYPGGDAHYAHGGHAGGPTFGAFLPAVFQTNGGWSHRYVRGFGDGNLIAPRHPRHR